MNTYPSSEEVQFYRRSGLYTVIFLAVIVAFVVSTWSLYQNWLVDDLSLVQNAEPILGVFFSLFYALIYINQSE